MSARVFDVKCQVLPAAAPRPDAFGHAQIDITVGGETVRHTVEANDANQPDVRQSGDLERALRGQGEWHFFFMADDESTEDPKRYSHLDIRVASGEVAIRTTYMLEDRLSRIPLRRGTCYRKALARAIREMMAATTEALDHYYGKCMEVMFD